ncbi:contractile injection system protein, VgrG/Pvc8 family [Paraburkholderia sp. BL17N1]|uniref:contractile injection system protein, VgrG/Pvc8 family n=1 Tax=Paraburkholderia sp. BL17N1 TaxID=1938798 RepID=UPI001F53F46E|nr:contractile injection system protein, VgrG/Pvc8 family [Paraburkholderia sp. BL17N1]
MPHAGDSWSDYERVSKARMLAHEVRSANADGVSGVRDLAVGRRFQLSGHPEVDMHPPIELSAI